VLVVVHHWHDSRMASNLVSSTVVYGLIVIQVKGILNGRKLDPRSLVEESTVQIAARVGVSSGLCYRDDYGCGVEKCEQEDSCDCCCCYCISKQPMRHPDLSSGCSIGQAPDS
jgi:hypothetical protein